MTKLQVRKQLTDYLNTHGIQYQLLNDSNKPMDIQELTTVHISFYVDDAPGKQVECAVWFYDDCMEVRGYYNQNAASWCCSNSNRIPAVMKVMNFINARVFPENLLYTPRLYLTVNESPEFAITTIIPYDFFELSSWETLEYITIFYPELLGKLSFPLFITLIRSITPEMAICHIKRELLGEKDAQIEWKGND